MFVVDPDTWLMDKIPEFVLRDEPDAILAVDTFGSQIELETDLPLLVDAAHGFMLPQLGHRGLIEVISLSFTKLVSAGQGAIFLTNNKDIYNIASELIRLSAKMLEVSAYLVLKEIRNYEDKVKIRNKIINLYREQIQIPYREQRTNFTNNSVYAIIFENQKIRDKVAQKFSDNGVEVKIYYQPLFRGLRHTENVFSKILALPVYPKLLENDIEFICNLINNI